MHRLSVLGAAQVLDPSGVPVRRLMQPRPLGLLAVLAVAGKRGVTRERVAELLWSESNGANPRRHLSDVLYLVHSELPPGAVTTAAQVVYLDATVLSSDVGEFRRALHGGDRASAVAAYGGKFLEGFHLPDAPEFDRWADAERVRLVRECKSAIDALAAAAERAARWRTAAQWWGMALDLDPYDTRLVVRRILALAHAGDRANAIMEAEEHRRRLVRELEVEPDAAFFDELMRIRRGEIRPSTYLTPTDTPVLWS